MSSNVPPAIVSSDPMVHLYKVRENILKNLSVNDLLNCSLCSRLWYEIIAVSDAFKEKVEIRVSNQKNPEVILASVRQYEKIFKEGAKDGPEVVLFSAKNFKTVEFSLDVDKMSDYVNYLEMFAHSVEKLSIWKIHLKVKDDTKIPYFPNLTQFNIDNVSVLTLLPFVRIHHKLTSLDIGDIQDVCGIHAKNVVYDILVKNKSITRLTLSAKLINDLFGNDIADNFQFKLEQVNIFSALRRKHVEKFLINHGETLKQITLMVMGDVTTRKMMKREKDFLSIFNIWSKMVVLKKLYLCLIRFKQPFRFNAKFIKSLNLTPNYGILEVAVQADNNDVKYSVNFLKAIMVLCPNTEFFRTEYLNKKTLRFLVKYMKKLKIIKCDYMRFGCVDLFNELKQNNPDIHPDLDLDGIEHLRGEESEDADDENDSDDEIPINLPVQLENLNID